MKSTAIIFLIALVWGGLVRAETANPELLFQKAMYLETAKGDYRGAIPVYEEIVKTQETNAQWAAKALHRMGLCWEKIGDQKKAGECALQIKDKYAAAVPENSDIHGFIRKYSREGAQQSEDKLRWKLDAIVIPELRFNEAKLDDIVSYLHQQSVACDTNSPASERGVNFVLKLSPPGGTVPTNVPKITFAIRDVSLSDAIRYITEMTGFKYRLENNRVVIMPGSMADGTLNTRTYKLASSVVILIAGTNGNNRPESFKEFFMQCGIPFPENASITYLPNQNIMVVKNTDDYLNKIEEILSKLNVPSMQVKVEAQQIEITGEQAAAMENKQNITRAYLEKIPKNQVRYVSLLSTITKPGVNANTKNTRLPSAGDREIGTYLNVTPVVGADNHTINLKFMWQSTELAGNANASGKTAANSVITKKEVITDFELYDQQSVVMRIQGESDSAGGNGTGAKQYLVVTATLLDPTGNCMMKFGPKSSEANDPNQAKSDDLHGR